jgi:type IV pilus assembly protein PilC
VALERMAVHFEKEAKLRALIRKAMVYPASLCLISVGVIVLMITVVIPKFMDMFADMNMELPAITLTIMGISDFFLTT